ncbi:right-handed parallel beta-helix repeat-containing protein [Pseudobythopirellula maris]|nr:right-handed parallel beta-helix repeat-containing protein [Pseudobythopirellula maris]
MNKTNLNKCVACAALLLLAVPLSAAEYFIAPGGSNGGSGAIGSPWGTFDYAIDQIGPGDTLFVRGGVYDLDERIRIQDAGTENSPIRIWAYQDETPVLDFDSMTVDWGGSSGRGIQVDEDADWVHLRGLTIQNARDNGVWGGSDHSIYERLTTRWNGDSGMQLSGPASHNLILNGDSYENYDPSKNGENADGFAIKFDELGPGNVVRGARAWGNSDDGWDMWESVVGGVLVEDSWSFSNGRILPGFYEKELLEDNDLTPGSFNGDGNGFKLGQDSGAHVLNRVVVWDNEERGIDVNGNGFGVIVANSTVFDSKRNWQFDEESFETTNQHILVNNVSYAGSSSDNFDSGVDSFSNTWDGGVSASAADFLSLDDTIARGPRQADGSLPYSDFLRLAPGSDLIDAGVNLPTIGLGYSLPFSGAAPDLGAYESGVYGDYNSDGVVDAADFTVWRDGLGGAYTAADYDVWVEHFGRTSATPPPSGTQSVPEPTALLLAVMAAFARSRRTYR